MIRAKCISRSCNDGSVSLYITKNYSLHTSIRPSTSNITHLDFASSEKVVRFNDGDANLYTYNIDSAFYCASSFH